MHVIDREDHCQTSDHGSDNSQEHTQAIGSETEITKSRTEWKTDGCFAAC